MNIKKKTMGRAEFRGMRDARLVTDYDPRARMHIGLLTIGAADAPLIVGDPPVTVMDAGMRWLELAPEDEPWFATVMFTASGELVEHYFDFNAGNRVEADGSVWFNDLFLDVIWRPGQMPELADGDELQKAVQEGLVPITRAVSLLASANRLVNMLTKEGDAFDALCQRWPDALKNR